MEEAQKNLRRGARRSRRSVLHGGLVGRWEGIWVEEGLLRVGRRRVAVVGGGRRGR